MDAFRNDIRQAFRILTRQPGLSAVAILSLALAIGANTALFSIINSVLLQPLPYGQPQQLVRIWETFAHSSGRGTGSVSVPNFADWREQNQSFQDLGAYSFASFSLAGEDRPIRISGVRVTAAMLGLLETPPLHGRVFAEGEDEAGRHQVVILSHGLWQRRFAARQSIVGESIRLNGENFAVVGVMAESFQFPPRSTAELWVPLVPSQSLRQSRGSHWMNVVGRLRPGADLDRAHDDLAAIAAGLAEAYPESQAERGVHLEPLPELAVESLRPALFSLWGAVGFVLLIGCVNVANLLLARSATRYREFAVRNALGAGRWRVMRQLLAESSLLALLGGAAGLLMGGFFLEWLAGLPGSTVPGNQAPPIDATVFGFCLGASLLAAVGTGLAPGLRSSRTNLVEGLTERSGGPGRGHDRLRSLLVVAEIALALVVLIGAGLMVRSYQLLQQTDPGFNTDRVLSLRVPLAANRYTESAATIGFYRELLAQVRSLPAVETAGLINMLPVQNWGTNGEFVVEGQPAAAAGQRPLAEYRTVTPGYFETMGIPLIRGRLFGQGDRADSPSVIVVNRALADRFFPGEDPVGRRISFDLDPDEEDDWVSIVGMVADVRNAGLRRRARPEIYRPYGQSTHLAMSLVLRTRTEPTALVGAVQQEVSRLDPEQPVYLVRTLEEVVTDSVARERFNTLLFSAFAVLALVLAVAGIYGVISYSVTQRTREIGVRMALGASRGNVLGLILKFGLIMGGAGAVVGLAVSSAVTRLLESQLFSVTATDPLTFAVITAALLVVTLLACWLPARRASRVDPMVALRFDG